MSGPIFTYTSLFWKCERAHPVQWRFPIPRVPDSSPGLLRAGSMPFRVSLSLLVHVLLINARAVTTHAEGQQEQNMRRVLFPRLGNKFKEYIANYKFFLIYNFYKRYYKNKNKINNK